MSINDIYSIASAPEGVQSFQGWERLEARLGTSLPIDYKEFIDKFGSVYVGRFISILRPDSKYSNLDLEAKLVQISQMYREIKMSGEHVPYKMFPARGGIFPFAQTDNGDFLFWETAGEPNKWRIIVTEGRGPEWGIFDLSMTEFIAGILTGQVKCIIFPDDFPPQSPKFEPID